MSMHKTIILVVSFGWGAALAGRATDEAGNVQPTRAALVTERGEFKTVPPQWHAHARRCHLRAEMRDLPW